MHHKKLTSLSPAEHSPAAHLWQMLAGGPDYHCSPHTGGPAHILSSRSPMVFWPGAMLLVQIENLSYHVGLGEMEKARMEQAGHVTDA